MKTIVFVNDSLRPDHLSCYGYDRDTSPNLDKLARDGFLFENTYAQSTWTAASSASILTSMYPLSHGCLRSEDKLETGSETVASKYSQNGVKTSCISAMFMVSEMRGYGEGFDEFTCFETDLDISSTRPDIAKLISNKVCTWLESNYEEDFFLFVWSSGTHIPYSLPSEYEPRFSSTNISGETRSLNATGADKSEEVKALYDDNIRYSDKEFGRILSKLKELGIYEESCIVSTADHGEVFNEHYRNEQSRFNSISKFLVPEQIAQEVQGFYPHGYAGHFDIMPYDELLHIPLILKTPNHEATDTHIDALVESIDIGPTILDFAGITDDLGHGASLIPVIDNGSRTREHTFSTSASRYGNHIFHSMRDQQVKYINIETYEKQSNFLYKKIKEDIIGKAFRVSHPKELFLDITQKEEPIPESELDQATKLREIFQNWKSIQNEDENESEAIEIDAKTEQHLQDLGYK